MKERMAEAAARREAMKERFEAEALERGVKDVDTYVKARIADAMGLEMFDPEVHRGPCLPPGQTLH